MNGKEAVGILIILAGAFATAGFALTANVPVSPCAGSASATRIFVIIASLDGYNDSKSRNGLGPEMSVERCDTVVINLVNRDVQSHGLSVEFYAANGIDSIGDQTVTVRFLASKPGVFRVFCNVVCSVHNIMQQAHLTVT